jgi:cell division protein FtsX
MKDTDRLQKTLNELRDAQSKLEKLDEDQAALMERLEKASRSQRRITIYVSILVTLCVILMGISFYVLIRNF